MHSLLLLRLAERLKESSRPSRGAKAHLTVRCDVGAGVGKGRTIAGLVLENWRRGRRRHLWISVGSDLKVDARRDMDDIGAQDIEIHPLNKLQYGRLDSEKASHLLAVLQLISFLASL